MQQVKLARVLHAHKSLRKGYHPSQYFGKEPNFDHASIPTPSLINHIYDDNGKKRSQDKLLNDDHSERWTQALSNELGRLTQGNAAGVSSNDAMDFIFPMKSRSLRKSHMLILHVTIAL